MTRMSSVVLVGLIAFASAWAQPTGGEVTLRVVKYEGLKQEILKRRGKVVLVDLWADFCRPCKKAFPHTVELHHKFESKGLAVVSVALDSLEEEPDKVKARALAFLKEQKATFANLLLDEPDEFWLKKFRIDTIPCVFVFSRDGKWTKFTSQELEDHPQNLDRLIEELLAEK